MSSARRAKRRKQRDARGGRKGSGVLAYCYLLGRAGSSASAGDSPRLSRLMIVGDRPRIHSIDPIGLETARAGEWIDLQSSPSTPSSSACWHEAITSVEAVCSNSPGVLLASLAHVRAEIRGLRGRFGLSAQLCCCMYCDRSSQRARSRRGPEEENASFRLSLSWTPRM
jgi:hypothetical protein